MSQVFQAPPRASFLQKLGPGGAASLGLAVFTAVAGALVPVAWHLRRVLREAEGDAEAPADLILILGRRLDGDRPTAVFQARLGHAASLWTRGLAPRLAIAGGTTGSATVSEAEAGRIWLSAHGIPAPALFLEDRSQHTLENLFNVRALMRAQGWERLLLVSDPLHLARAGATARGLGLEVRCLAAPGCPPPRGGPGWWGRALLEAFYLHWYRTGILYSRLIRSRDQLARVT